MPHSQSMLRTALPLAIALAVAFGLGAAGGFAFAHEPSASEVVLRIDRERAADGPIEAVIAGEVLRLDGAQLLIATSRGPLQVDLSGLAVEELTRTADLGVGARVNLGGEQTPFGLALSGIVAIEGTAAP